MQEHGVATFNGLGKWKNPRLLYQGFEYALVKNTTNVTYYKCVKGKCSGRLNKRGEICTNTRGHNLCRPMPNLQSEAERIARNMNQSRSNPDNDTDQEDMDDPEPPPLDEMEDTSSSPRHKLNRLRVPPVHTEQVLELSTQESQQTSADTSLEESQTTDDEVPPPRENRTGFKKRTFTPPLVWGFDRGLRAKEIVGSSNYRGPIKFLVRWEGCNQMDLVSAQEMNERFPEVVIAFYEKRLGWNKPPKPRTSTGTV